MNETGPAVASTPRRTRGGRRGLLIFSPSLAGGGGLGAWSTTQRSAARGRPFSMSGGRPRFLFQSNVASTD